MKKELIIEIGLAVVLIALVWSIYFGFFYYAQCSTDLCFADALVKCEKTIYAKDGPELFVKYKILGASSNQCEINVELKQVKKGSLEMGRFEGKDMVCSISLGSLVMPESNLQNCKGDLREEIQEAVINNMHSQIVENVKNSWLKP
jgi:hypothetical protein